MSATPLHSHVVVGITHALKPQDLRALTPGSWRILSYSESATLGGVPMFSFTLPGRATVASDGHRRPWREILSVGDLVQAAGWTNDGQSTPQAVTMADGLIISVSTRKSLQPGGYEYVTDVSCAGLQHVLMQDSVAWWMYYGSAEGWTAARGKLLSNDLSGRVDKMLANYLNKVVFHSASWNRDGVGLGARLGYHLKALTPNSPINTDLAIAEGTHWSIMSQFLDEPLHQLYTSVRPESYAPQGGYAHRPSAKPEKAIVGQIAADGGRTWIMMRPAPYPHADATGKGVLKDWQALPLHDYSHAEAKYYQGQGQDKGDSEVRNFFMVYPAYQFLDESMSFTAGIAVENRESIQRFSYRPLKTRTHLVLGEGAEEDMLTLARSLTWRIAGQYNHLEDYLTGQFILPFDPTLQVGDRVRFRDPDGDQTKQALMEAHVVAFSRQWDPENGGTSTVQVERVAPVSHYADASNFIRGLAPVKVAAQDTAPSTKPEPPK